VQDLRFRAKVLLKDAKSAARWLRTTGASPTSAQMVQHRLGDFEASAEPL
jgi:hypothetical protein